MRRTVIWASAFAMAAGAAVLWGGAGVGSAAPGALETYKGCVRQLDAAQDNGLQAILDHGTPEQIVVRADEPILQDLLRTAFLWAHTIEVTYEVGTPNVAKRVKLDRFYTEPCNYPDSRAGGAPTAAKAQPSITRLDPPAYKKGSAVTLRVMGSGFSDGDWVVVGGGFLKTTCVSASELDGEVPATVTTGGALEVKVHTFDGNLSNSVSWPQGS
jgi:hypothetical protein